MTCRDSVNLLEVDFAEVTVFYCAVPKHSFLDNLGKVDRIGIEKAFQILQGLRAALRDANDVAYVSQSNARVAAGFCSTSSRFSNAIRCVQDSVRATNVDEFSDKLVNLADPKFVLVLLALNDEVNLRVSYFLTSRRIKLSFDPGEHSDRPLIMMYFCMRV